MAFTFVTMMASTRRKVAVSPHTKRTLGEKLIREFAMWTVAAIFVVIAMTIMYQVIITVVVPELTSGMSGAPAMQTTVPIPA